MADRLRYHTVWRRMPWWRAAPPTTGLTNRYRCFTSKIHDYHFAIISKLELEQSINCSILEYTLSWTQLSFCNYFKIRLEERIVLYSNTQRAAAFRRLNKEELTEFGYFGGKMVKTSRTRSSILYPALNVTVCSSSSSRHFRIRSSIGRKISEWWKWIFESSPLVPF